ncbi:peptidoglycan editing factor PgeF [Paenibacillus eucommiae]|uniref:Purine nucleoside phosphorylase n=1 Tax=Paenibacillus eucommiae TaxID=1355755 RepID=A0ABS4IYW8_9BACL|nr:peptidoglycan editing factor PgeF [Paenibacillus eucommiae]MBP1992783.1 YfiH family protein [Paenibacillus eucommiae]
MEPFNRVERENHPPLFYIASWMQQFPGLSAGFTSRHGGVSESPFSSLNCGLHVHDSAEHVVSNRERLADAIGMPFQAFTYAEQVHGKDICVVTAAEKGMGRASREHAIQARDGFITKEKGQVLCALFADCVPLFFYDPVREAAGLAHAGWKGTVLNIASATINAMHQAFGSEPQDIRAAIGPSIGVCCYEIDNVVADQVKGVIMNNHSESDYSNKVLIAQPGNKYKLNLQELNRNFIEKAGIMSSHIEVTQLCTSCSTDDFFSHRKEGGSTGRMAAWIAMS